MLTDPARIPEWSHECRDVELLDPGPAGLGFRFRFRGLNRAGRNRWSRIYTVFRSDVNTDFAYLTSGGPGDATAWHFRLEPTATGTRLVQAYQIVSMPAWLSAVVGLPIPAHRDRSAALRDDLQRLGVLAENAAPVPTSGSKLESMSRSDDPAGRRAHLHLGGAAAD